MTTVFIFVIIFIVAVYDVWVIWKKGKTHSISAVIIRSSKQYPLITLMVGVLIGHLYWRMDDVSVYGECKKIEEVSNAVP